MGLVNDGVSQSGVETENKPDNRRWNEKVTKCMMKMEDTVSTDVIKITRLYL